MGFGSEHYDENVLMWFKVTDHPSRRTLLTQGSKEFQLQRIKA